uniref:Uncharacterized protein n=1 Tax=Ditylum brightwellii TaxID=49249 RepID=A0A6S9HRJ5_9STRA|mmetsp:Transcript_38032/g.55796  ORF Transcript_38032/g.55796 Transcript_38032/m.55796 type:complete len:128 (+) Transcript_38032:364-747(+)
MLVEEGVCFDEKGKVMDEYMLKTLNYDEREKVNDNFFQNSPTIIDKNDAKKETKKTQLTSPHHQNKKRKRIKIDSSSDDTATSKAQNNKSDDNITVSKRKFPENRINDKIYETALCLVTERGLSKTC